jgi:signal transduction histidine kinase
MEKQRWWHLAVAAVAILLTVVVVLSTLPGWQLVGALAPLAVLVISWFTFGRLSWRNAAASVAFTLVILVTTGTAVAFFPQMAILQVIGYPLLWMLADSVRSAILTNCALAVAVAAGFLISTGDLPQTLVTVGFSLGFSIAIGMWISSIWGLSDQRRELILELQAAQQEVAALSRDAGISSERERLAREIHDTIAQDLTGLVLLSQRATRELASDDRVGATEALALLEESARSALAETRALVAASAPPTLAEGGIAPALERLGSRFERETAVSVTVQADARPLERDLEVVLLRCAQESLANVRKHAGASHVAVDLVSTGHEVRLSVTDDGRGFDQVAVSSGYGLTGMRDRLALVAGSLDIASDEHGTTVQVILPIRPVTA